MYWEQQEPISPEYISKITLVESHLILTEVIWKNTETKKLVYVKGTRRDREPSQFKILSLALSPSAFRRLSPET